MKKYRFIMSIFLVLCLLCGCRGLNEPLETIAETSLATTTPAEATQEDSESTVESVQLPLPESVSALKDFLDDVNRNGKLIIRPEDETDAPGTMVDAACVPDSDRTALYGMTYRFRLTIDDASDLYYFQYNTVDNQLTVVIPCSNLPLLLIFRPEVNSAEEFAQIARDGTYLSATLLYARNMASDQLMYLSETYYILENTTIESDPSARYLVGEAAVGSTEVYGTHANDVTTRFDRILSAYYHPFK